MLSALRCAKRASETGRNRGSAANWKSVPETDIIDLLAMAARLVGTRRVPAVERAFRAANQGDRCVAASDGSLAIRPLPSRWLMRAAQTDRAGQSSLRVHDSETALEGAAAGLGKTLLPILAADR